MIAMRSLLPIDQIQVLDQLLMFVKAERQGLGDNKLLAGERRSIKGKIEGPDIGQLIETLMPLECLDPRLHSLCLVCLGPEAVDELLHILALLLVIHPCLLMDLFFQEYLLNRASAWSRGPSASCSDG